MIVLKGKRMKKKSIKKGFAIAMSLALALQCVPAAAFAAEDSHGVDPLRPQTFGYGGGVLSGADYVRTYDSSSYNKNNFNYVALGDSITQGFSLDGFISVSQTENAEAQNENVFYNISNSPESVFPKQVAKMFKDKGTGTFNVKNLGFPSLTTRGVYDILRGKYEAKDKNGNLYDYGAYYFCFDGTMTADENKLNAAVLQAGGNPLYMDKAEKTEYLMNLDPFYENLKPYYTDANGKYLSDSNVYIEGIQPIVKKSFLPETKDYTSLFRDQLKDADLVTLSIGSNDVMRKLNTMLFYDKAVPDNKILQSFNQLMTLANGGDMDLSSLELTNGAPVGVILRNILNINGLINEGVTDFKETFPLAVQEVEKYTPDDAKICLLGLYNPFGLREYAYLIATLVDGKQLTPTLVKAINTAVDTAYALVTELPASMLSDLNAKVTARINEIMNRASGQALSIDVATTVNDVFFLMMPLLVATVGTAVESPLDKMEAFVKEYANKNGYTFVPLEKVRSRGNLDPHPAPDGHKDIAEAVVNACGDFNPGNVTTELPFTDVRDIDWFFDGVKYCYNKGIMNGVSDTLFAPQTSMNRAMIVTMLYRMEGEPNTTIGQPFADVPVGEYYDKAVRWAFANNIVTGYDRNKFAPLATITREQLAAIFYRYTDYKNLDTTCSNYLYKFSDAGKISSYAVEPMAWAYYHGIVNGVSSTTIEPAGSATRAQAATIIQRYNSVFGI